MLIDEDDREEVGVVLLKEDASEVVEEARVVEFRVVDEDVELLEAVLVNEVRLEEDRLMDVIVEKVVVCKPIALVDVVTFKEVVRELDDEEDRAVLGGVELELLTEADVVDSADVEVLLVETGVDELVEDVVVEEAVIPEELDIALLVAFEAES